MYTCTAFRATMQQERLQTACAIHALLSQPSTHSLTFVSLLADAIQASGKLTRFAQVAVSQPQAAVSFQEQWLWVCFAFFFGSLKIALIP